MSYDTFSVSTLQILRDLSSQLGVNYDSGEIRVVRDEREFVIFLYLPLAQYSKVGTPSFFEIKTKIPFPHPLFSIRKSNSIDWIKEHVLTTPDFQIGDADFDANFHIRVKDSDWGSQFFSRNKIKFSISELLLEGFDLIHSEDGDLKVVKYLQLGGPYPTVEMINNALERLGQIISSFPEDYTPPTPCRLKDYNYWKPLVNLIVFLFILGGIVYWYVTKFVLNPVIYP